MKLLESVQTARQWREACDKVKNRRGGRYPDDWWPRMKLSGKMDQIFARFGGSTEIKIESP